jgi:restriction system protein
VILRHSDGTTTGIQVKRSRNPIDVEQLRSLAGALVQGGHVSGVFVTTSRFTSDARRAATTFESRGYPIELFDANRFLDALHISQRPAYASYDEWHAAHGEQTLHVVYDDR